MGGYSIGALKTDRKKQGFNRAWADSQEDDEDMGVEEDSTGLFDCIMLNWLDHVSCHLYLILEEVDKGVVSPFPRSSVAR